MRKILLILLFLLCTCNIPVFSQDISDDYSYEKHKTEITINYERIERAIWNKYFKTQGKALKKNWKKNKSLFQPAYNTSYARVLFVVNRKGEIISYKIKSSCVPYSDDVFINQVKQTINSLGKFDNLPNDYRHDFIIFTVKFHSKLPQNLHTTKIDEKRFGVADIELDKQSVNIILK